MAKQKKVEEAEVIATHEVEAPIIKPSKNTATVKYRGNVRVYTRELHGDDFAELAKEFADKVGGVVA